MPEIRKTRVFVDWLNGLHDIRASSRILVRIEHLAMSNSGDVKPVGKGVSEMRIKYGPGYRVYLKSFGNKLIILLAGGDKCSQSGDIKTALRLMRDLQENK
ncbi:MAG: type II toxin-antitoxin system RelE/ParE family toxin [Nitrosomonas sp.]|uniref:type II toxin-antitoxin system RelE/ParE family toxin n=1 Tax=Nitrosomonas sp. TaxID=42353 RepID=UPI001DFB4BF8|nr:type II toxin-antitoxin system RelE/ParE family toxin [Nitrosomonas sp.]MBX9893631.1 type II toxin-antitoxin system RelE/ParE family toxin [Nitrosomonas sp.]